jgi:hypothetical protein
MKIATSTSTLGSFLALLIAFVPLGSTVSMAKEKPAYQVGSFLASRQVSDGSYSQASCGGFSCSGSSYSAAHNVHEVQASDGVYTIEAPVSVGGTLALGMLSNGNSPTVHKQWFMDSLHEGDKVLFSAQCNKHYRCTIRLPNPDKPEKVIETQGFFSPAAAKTNAGVLCGTGKLSADVEAQVCNQPTTAASVVVPQPAPPAARPAQTEMPPQAAAPVAPQSQEHASEGSSVNGPGAGSVDGSQVSLGDAARAARAKKNADAQR